MPLAPPVTMMLLGSSGFMFVCTTWNAAKGLCRPSTLEHGLQLFRREPGSEIGIRRYRGVALRVEPLCTVRIGERKDGRRFLVDRSLIGRYALAYRKAHVCRRAVERVVGVWLARALRIDEMAIHLVVACNRRDGRDRKVALFECLDCGQRGEATIRHDGVDLRILRDQTDRGLLGVDGIPVRHDVLLVEQLEIRAFLEAASQTVH